MRNTNCKKIVESPLLFQEYLTLDSMVDMLILLFKFKITIGSKFC